MRKWLPMILPVLIVTLLVVAGCGSKGKEPADPTIAPGVALPPPPIDHTNDPVILALGDSLTAGQGVAPEEAWPTLVQYMIDRAGRKFRVVNAGISGETSAGGVDRVDELLSKYKPFCVVLELGANDGLQGLAVEQMQQNLATIIQHSQKAGAKVLLAGMQMPPNLGPDYTRAFTDTYPALAHQYHTELIPFFLDGVAGHPELNQLDGIHPTPEGHQIVARTVWHYLEPMLPNP